MCLQYLQYFLFCAASLRSSVEAVYLCGNKTCFSLWGGQYCLPGHSCNQHFFERNNSSGVLLFQGKGETAAGSRWGWLFCLGFFCSSSACYRELLGAECPEGLRAEQQAADHKQAWEFEQASVRTWVRREREFGWGFVGLLVWGVF